MRLRFHPVMYQAGSAAPGLEHHYSQLRGAMFQLGQQYPYIQPGAVWRPAMDIHETSGAVLVKIELAGIEEESIEITLYPNAIVVAGQRIDDSASDEETYYHEAQIRYGPFRADAYLSTPVQPEMATAVYQNGFLRVTLPRLPQEGKSSEGPVEETDGTRGEGGANGSSVATKPLAWQPATSESATIGLNSFFSKETSHA